MATGNDVWTAAHVRSLAPDAASVPAAQQVLKKGGFGTVEPTGDGRGWWVVCRGITDTYQVSVRHSGTDFDCECTCPSPKYPCKHALALLLYLVDHPELRTEAAAPKAVASDFEGLLRAVFANPDDDTPRLVFADFLEENDQPDRAAFIRYQCEQARLKPQSKRGRELTKLVRPLLAKLRKEIEPLPEGIEYEFDRGFMRISGYLGALGDLGALPARFARLFRDGWVESVGAGLYDLGLRDATDGATAFFARVGELDLSEDYPMSDEDLVALVAATGAARAAGRLVRVKVNTRNQKAFDQLVRTQQGERVALTALDTDLGPDRYHGGLTPALFDLTLRAGRFDGARTLTLSGNLGDAELSALLATADLSELRALRLEGWHLTRAGAAALANSPVLGRLTELGLEQCAIGSREGAAVPPLASATGLRGLEVLRLVACGLLDADAAALANARSFPKLKHLDLTGNHELTARGAAAVLAPKHVPHLSRVDLVNTRIASAEQLPLLLDAPDRPHLTVECGAFTARRAVERGEVIVEMVPRGNDHGELFAGLAKCAGAKRVTQFSAPRLAVGAAQVRELAAGFDPEALWRLDITDNPLRNDGADALATAFAAFARLELKLSACRIQSVGAAALVNGPLFAKARTLDLSQNNIGKAGVAAVLKADVPTKLKELVLTDCRLGDDEKKKLKAKYGPRVKV
ncbi:MAG: TIGR02996 domain-containing protein [Planctomycetes bacterium]|nr:TIGR02996 domain-containing protein [Planctomycetota bacterium]